MVKDSLREEILCNSGDIVVERGALETLLNDHDNLEEAILEKALGG